jgi:hypothetical protein
MVLYPYKISLMTGKTKKLNFNFTDQAGQMLSNKLSEIKAQKQISKDKPKDKKEDQEGSDEQ